MLAGMRGESRQAAMERLLPLVYDELRALARAQLRHERPDHTLQATALVHEAYLRLLGGTQPPMERPAALLPGSRRGHAPQLIEHARKRGRVKRGGKRVRVELTGVELAGDQDLDQILALDDAFRRLEEQDPERADLVRQASQ